MYVLYKSSKDNSNIVGYFTNLDVIYESLKITYCGIKGMTLGFNTNGVEVLSIVGNKKETIDRFIIEPLFIQYKPDHL